MIQEECSQSAIAHAEGTVTLRSIVRHVSEFIDMEVFGEILSMVAAGGNIDTEVLERFHGGAEVHHLVTGALVGRVQQRISGQPAATSRNRLNVGLSAEHEQESGRAALLGMADQRGRVHIARQRGSTSLRIVGGNIPQRHQQSQRTVQDELADLRLLAQRVVLVTLAFATLLEFVLLFLLLIILSFALGILDLTLLVVLLQVLQNPLVHFLQIWH